MEKSTYKTLYWSVVIITVGFAVMEFMDENAARASLWLAIGSVVLIGMSLWDKKRKQKQNQSKESSQTSALTSILTEDQKKDMKKGELIPLQIDQKFLKPKEILYWADQARQDHYDGKEGLLLLSDQNIAFENPDFSFRHPVHLVKVKETKNGIELEIRGRKMKFVTASNTEFLEVWKQLRGSSSIQKGKMKK
ncbi:hypothetical protein [Ileibacterium valens]|nr:hypothetical protein [Ileibacterium valens]